MTHISKFTKFLRGAAATAILTAGIFVMLPDAASAQATLTARMDHTATLLQNGNFLILGGKTAAGAYISDVQIYDVKTSQLYTVLNGTGAVNAARSNHTATLIPDGRVIIAGGENMTNNISYYDPVTNVLANFVTGLPHRMYHTATLLRDGGILIAGGMDNNSLTVSNSLIARVTGTTSLDTAVTITNTSNMITPRYGHTATLLPNGHVFVAGGINATSGQPLRYVETTEIYDPVSDTWSPGPALVRHRAFHTATTLNSGYVILAGGKDNTSKTDTEISMLGTQGYIDEVEKYDPFSNTIVPTKSLPARVSSHTATLSPSGDLELLGGYGNFIDQHFGGPFTIMNSTMVFSSIAGSTVNVNINPVTSSITIVMAGNFATGYELSGTFVDAYVFFDTSTVESTNFLLGVNPNPFILAGNTEATYQTISDISGKNIFSGKLRGEFPLMINNGSATFTAAEFAASNAVEDPLTGGTVSISPDALNPVPPGGEYPTDTGAHILVSANISLAETEYINANAPQGQTHIINAYARAINLSLANGDKYTVEYANTGEGPATNLPVAVDFFNNAYTGSVRFDLTMGVGVFYNNDVDSAPAGNYDFGVSAGQLNVEFAASPVGVTGLAFQTSVATCAVKEFIFAENFSYTPKSASWSNHPGFFAGENFYGNPIVSPFYRHAAILTPAADLIEWGGEDCTRAGRTISPTPSYYETWANCRTGQQIAINRRHGILGYSTGWTSGPSLAAKRGQHTANILANGKILVTGGTNGAVTLASAEILDPKYSTSTWQSASTMTDSRSNHTATMLPNGNILVAGGYTQGVTTGSLKTAEIYYPAENAWVPTGSMSTPRQSHSAIMVPKGTKGGYILVIGGYSNNTYLNTMELYNPISAGWETVSTTLSIARAQHSATLLHNGNILVCGGVNGSSGTLSSCETIGVNDNGTFSIIATASLNQKRHSHTATLLRDGRVEIIGGNNGAGEIRWQNPDDATGARSAPTSEIAVMAANGNISGWTIAPTNRGQLYPSGAELMYGRQNHTATLLPNGKILILGGVTGLKQAVAEEESFDPDFSTWTHVGSGLSKGYHTTVMTSSGIVMAIGGYDGNNYVESTNYRYFMLTPDANDPNTAGANSVSMRQPSKLSIDQSIISPAATVTLQSGSTNFFGISEGSGGGNAGQNGYHSHPRMYVYMMDNPSGWMLDISSIVYSTNNLTNISNWDLARSSITFTVPNLPYSWYQLRAANNALFSDGVTTFVSKPRPAGTVSSVYATAKTTNTVSWIWTWNPGAFSDTDGFEVRSTTNNVFFATVAYIPANSSATYIQSGLEPNTRIGIQVGPYNISRAGDFVKSSTYYTFANPPAELVVASATFSTVSLAWNASSNSVTTQYEVSMAGDAVFTTNVSTPVPFSMALTTNSVTVTNLSAGKEYFFRVRARNGNNETTSFNCGFTGGPVCPSTKTITSPSSVQGVANGTTTIRWSWQQTESATTYEVYSTTEPNTLLGTVTQTGQFAPSYTMVGLSTNTAYSMLVRAVNGSGSSIYSELTQSPTVYTLADIAAPYGDLSQTLTATTGTITAFWIGQTNPAGTKYEIQLASTNTFASVLTTMTVTQLPAQPYMTAVFTGLTPSSPFWARVRALNGDSIPTEYVLLSTSPKYTSPSAPANFVPSDITASGVTLTWSSNGNAEGTRYQLSYSTWPNNTAPATLLAFADNFTTTSTRITGLWTATSYYFYLGAKNNSPIEDAKNYSANISMAPEYILTLNGPTGTSTGAVSGFTGQGTVTGTLPSGRTVTLTIPTASFASTTTEVSIAENPSVNLCPSVGVPVISFEMLTTGDAQPQVPVTFDFTYTSAELAGVDKTKLVLARYNTKTRECMPLQTTVAPSGTRKITATLNHFSTFQLMIVTPPSDLENVFIYPNPFYPNRGNGFVTFNNLPTSVNVRIYTLTGQKVWEGTKNSAGPLIWEGKNSSGNAVASGVYLTVIEGAGQSKIFKVAVER